MPTLIGLLAIPRVAQLFILKEAFSRELLLTISPPPQVSINQKVTLRGGAKTLLYNIKFSLQGI